MSALSQFSKAAAVAILVVALISCKQGGVPSDTAAEKARLAALESKVAYLTDREHIHDVYLRYMRGFDRDDVHLLKSAFWPDAQINYGTQSNAFDEFVALHLYAQVKRHANYAHLITNESVDLKGDTAHVESYVTQLITSKDGKSMIVSGRYIDRLDRRDGEWRIAVREFVPHFWTDTNTNLNAHIDGEGTWWPRSGCMRGTWDRHDPSYRRPLDARTKKSAGPACAE